MAMTFMSSMRVAMIPVIVTMVIPMLVSVVITMVFRVITMLITMLIAVLITMIFRVIAMIFAVLIAVIAMASLLNVHTTIKMLRLSPHQRGTNLCFDREASLVG